MTKMKFLGIIDLKNIEEFNIREIEYYLGELEIYENRMTEETFSRLMKTNFKIDHEMDIDEIKTKFYPPINLINEFCEFIYNHYGTYSAVDKYFIDFNNEIYGLEFLKQKKIALQNFNYLYNCIKITVPDVIHKSKSFAGIENTISEGKLFKVYMEAITHKKELATTANITAFLGNNIKHYDDLFFEKDEVKSTISLMSISKILSQLNDRFRFEKDEYFTGHFGNSFIYEEYKHIFNSADACYFTNKYLTNIEDLTPSYVYALYEFLIKTELIRKNDAKFMDFIDSEHGLKITKIHNYDNKKENLNHTAKLQDIKNLWENFIQQD